MNLLVFHLSENEFLKIQNQAEQNQWRIFLAISFRDCIRILGKHKIDKAFIDFSELNSDNVKELNKFTTQFHFLNKSF